jgi:excisionase family DNA binding protein
MKLKIKIAEVAGKYGLKSAYALQKALECSPTMASRLWKGNFKQIGIETIESLCGLFNCSPNDFLEYPLTQTSNTQTSNDITQLSNTELSKTQSAPKPKQKGVLWAGKPPGGSLAEKLAEGNSGKGFNHSVLDIVQSSSDNEVLLSSVEVAERLNVSRKSVNDYIIDGKLPAVKGKQNHNFIRESDLLAFMAKK